MITRTKPHKPDVAQIVTNQILDALDRGIVPWRKPWKTELPKNLISRKVYKGINLLLLSFSPYSSPYYLTFKQVEELGGHIVAGSKGFRIIYWRILEHVSPQGELTTIPLLKYYVVFNLEQVGGIPEDKLPKVEKAAVPPIGLCERIVQKMPNRPVIETASSAYYSTAKDTIGIPSKKLFVNSEEYYSTLFHEMVHSTSHPSRLNREVKAPRYSMKEDYSREELVAELGSAFLCAYSRISPKTIDNQASYIAGWLEALNNDRWFILSASAAASKAANYIIGVKDNHIAEASTWEGDYHANY
ncbi:MAG: zincin-like metallopeptidase domain-containing protein [Candidatus Edwardsbacteria bacterium]|nr:zincin-like metallopeptidase domain-containing protein [Candidatus Edwardsbacteria bacterium]